MTKYFALLLLGVASLSFAQGVFAPPQTAFKVVNGYTTPVANATITVCAAGAAGIPCAPVLLSTIFKDQALTQPLSNPFTADAFGNYQFAATSATYTVTVTASGFVGNSYQVTLGGSGGGSGGPFNLITSGTNSGAAMFVGTGASLGYTGSGTINSNALAQALGTCRVQTFTAGGTLTQYSLVQIDTTGRAVTANTTGGTYGVAQAAATVGNPVALCVDGYSNLVMDGTSIPGDLVTPSGTTGGQGHDSALTSRNSISLQIGAPGTITTGCSGVGCTAVVSLDGINRTGRQVGFSLLQPGTNNAGAFFFGTGASLSTSGSGTITATSAATVPFSGLTPGTNNAGAFIIGTGASLSTSGSGTITVNAVPFAGITSSTNSTAAMVEGTGANLSSSGSGQVAGTQLWVANSFLQPPTVTTSGTGAGGSFIQGHSALVRITFNTAAGETLPGPLGTGLSCGVGSGCTATVTHPTIPSGYTGYTVYSCDTSNSVSCAAGSLAKQTALAACVNITVDCVISTPGAGSAVPTTTSAFVQPPNVQASDCPTSVLPSGFVQTNDGNNRTLFGVDTNTANSNTGVFTYCRQVFFSDLGNASSSFRASSDPISYNNAMIAFNHDHSLYSQANQNRMLAGLSATPVNFAGTLYAAELMQFEMDKNCNGCTINGSPDGEFTLASFQLQDNSATNTASTNYGTNIMRLQYYKAGAGQDTNGQSGINTLYTLNNSAASNSFAFYKAQINGTAVGSSTNGAIAFWDTFNASYTLGNGQIALYAQGAPGGGNNDANFLIRNDSNANLPSNLNGPATVSQINNNNVASMPVNASMALSGALTVSRPGSMNGPSAAGCTGGASQYSYVLVGVDSNGGQFVSSAQNTASTCTNPLTVGNPATVGVLTNTSTIFNTYANFARIDVYRTGGPMATGKIGSITCSVSQNAFGGGCTSFSDTGLAATGAVPAANTAGGIGSVGIISGGNTKQVASDFTSAANTSLQTITGLTWNLSQAAGKYSFHCALNYSQATAAVAMQFGIQVATAAPNSVDAKGRVDTSASAATSGTLNGLSTTTATAIVTFTPSATATVFGADLDGTIDLPQNNAGNLVNIMVQTSNAGDLPTIKRGSYCAIHP